MEQHQIPQQISSYQFRLVGDMTLKQFFQVGGGALVAIILYSSGLPSYIKWPFILVSFLFGVALAFFPVEDRPLSKWLVLFAKSIYAPTLYIWMKNYQKPLYFQPEDMATNLPASPIAQVQSVQDPVSIPEVEKNETQFLNQVSNQLNSTTEPPIQTSVSTVIPELPQERPEPQVVPLPPVSIPMSEKPKEETSEPKEEIKEDETPGIVSEIAGEKIDNAPKAQFAPDSAPSMPTLPNILVGQVMTQDGKIVENAILEVRDQGQSSDN